MNYNDYKNKMTKDDRIESLDSLQIYVDLIVIMDNIKFLEKMTAEDKEIYKYLGANIDELSFVLKEKKDEYIRMAVRKSYPRKWAIDAFGQGYAIQVEILKKSMQSRMASFYGIETNKLLE